MKIAVLMGGPSSEREISLKSGAAVYEALVGLGHEAVHFDLDQDIIQNLKSFNPDLVFNTLHGKPGEDGTVQGLLEILGFPYTGSGVLSSALTMDKIMTKRLLAQAGIPTPDFLCWNEREYTGNEDRVHDIIVSSLGLPLVIKAPTQGSTIGIYIVREKEELGQSIRNALGFESRFMAETFLPGPEVTAAVIGNENPLVLPLIEIISHTGFYDYQAKYTPGLSDHIIPPRLPEKVLSRTASLASQVYTLMGCRGFARVDFIVSENEYPQVIEINSIPGMTSTSLVPDAALAAGLSFPDLIQKIVDLALE